MRKPKPRLVCVRSEFRDGSGTLFSARCGRWVLKRNSTKDASEATCPKCIEFLAWAVEHKLNDTFTAQQLERSRRLIALNKGLT